MPTFCPEVLPPAVQLQNFIALSATFSFPSSIEVEGDGISVDVLEVSLATLTGVPLGIEIKPNNSNGIYYPSNGEESWVCHYMWNSFSCWSMLCKY